MLDRGLREHARRAPRRSALLHRGRSTSYGELEDQANRLAQVLRECGLVRGDHVACLLPNGPDIFAFVWAAYRCGLYITPVPTTLAPPEAAYIINNCNAKLVWAHHGCAALAATLPALAPNVAHWLSVGGSVPGYADGEASQARAASTPIIDETPGALMLYTSGTTGAPKGVCRPLLAPGYDGLPPFARDLLELFELGGDAVRYLAPAPLYHAAPLRTSLAITAGGGSVLVMDRFDAAQALTHIQQDGITHSQWVPTMFQRLLALPAAQRAAFSAPAHRVAVHGAAPCPLALKRAMIEWWGPILLEYYAGSEGVGVTLIDSLDWLAHPGSVGRARRGEVHILDDADKELAPGLTGRIFFAGVPAFGYFGADDKTATRTSAQGFQTLGDVGWADANGYLYLTDRADDMIISGGVNLYPQEIEAVLAAVPGVADCGVVGVASERFGQTPVAFVVASAQAAQDTAALRQRISQALGAALGRIKQPSAVHLVAELPRSDAGKLLRRKLAALLPP